MAMTERARGLRGLLSELKRRRVPQVAIAYAAAAFVIAQAADLVAPGLHLPEWALTLVLLLLILSFPLALVLAWVFDVGPRGIERTPKSAAPAVPRPQPDGASIAAYQRAAELDTLWIGAPNNLGNALNHLGRYAEALEAYGQVLELAPGSGPLILNTAGAPSRLGRHKEAVARAREVHARQGDSWSLSGLAGLCSKRVSLPRPKRCSPPTAGGTRCARTRAGSRCSSAGFPEDAIRRSRELYERRKGAGAGGLGSAPPKQLPL